MRISRAHALSLSFSFFRTSARCLLCCMRLHIPLLSRIRADIFAKLCTSYKTMIHNRELGGLVRFSVTISILPCHLVATAAAVGDVLARNREVRHDRLPSRFRVSSFPCISPAQTREQIILGRNGERAKNADTHSLFSWRVSSRVA